LIGVVAGLLVVLAGLLLVLYQIVRQQGRMLLRLDALDGGPAADALPEPLGLQVGDEFPAFALRDLAGRKVELAGFRGRRVLLVNWSPDCGFCDLIAPDLAELQPKLEQRGVEIVLVSHGALKRNRELAREHGLTATILRQQDDGLEAFEYMGTPVGYLLDEEGRVARPLARGADEVLELGRKSAGGRRQLASERSLANSRIEREGLKPGTRAPEFTLPDVRGGRISLGDYRGRRVLLVFSDPHCGPCDALAPELARLARERSGNGLEVVMVGRGDLEENRRKAEEHGLDFPFVVQDRWKLSKQYGIFATPVAFLIGKGGLIEEHVAQGGDAILRLAATAF
jgi:peroxiredoxin